MGPLTKTGVLPKWKSCPLASSKDSPFLKSLLPTWVKFGVLNFPFLQSGQAILCRGNQHQRPRNGLQHPNSLISSASNKWEAGEPDRAATWSHGGGLPWGPAHIERMGTSAIHISLLSPGPHLPCQPAGRAWLRLSCFAEKIYSSRLTYMDVCI